jgi:hypothetical protein
MAAAVIAAVPMSTAVETADLLPVKVLAASALAPR